MHAHCKELDIQVRGIGSVFSHNIVLFYLKFKEVTSDITGIDDYELEKWLRG